MRHSCCSLLLSMSLLTRSAYSLSSGGSRRLASIRQSPTIWTKGCFGSIPSYSAYPTNDYSSHSFVRPISSVRSPIISGSSTRLCSTTEDTMASSSSSSLSVATSVVLEGLNPSQVEAVTQPTKAITRVIAGPGSGKTRVLTCRVVHLLDQDPHGSVLAVTFTRKASGEMQKRVEHLLKQQQEAEREQEEAWGNPVIAASQDGSDQIVEEGSANVPPGLSRVTLGTFHSICAKILRFNGNLLATLPSIQNLMTGQDEDATVNLDGSFAILDQSDQLRIVKECLDEAEVDLKQSTVKPMQILTAIGQIKDAQAQGNDPFQNDDKRKPVSKPMRIAKQIYRIYREKILSNNALDFDDLIFMTREMLLVHEDLRERLHRRWPHVLVDEFQDTSKTQMDLVRLLTSSSLLIVGDADQSIYSWRGAHAGSLSDFKTEFDKYIDGGVSTVYLKENYRSTSNIVRAAEKVISSSGKASKGEKDESRRAMKPKRGSGPSPRVIACLDERAEANFVVDTVLEMIADSDLTAESTVAVIYRTNAQSRYLEEACVQKNLPYVIRGGAGGFYKRAEVKDCLCFLRWLYNGNDESAMMRAFKTPSKGIGDKALASFKEYFTEIEIYYRDQFSGIKRPTRLEVLIALTDEEFGSGRLVADDAPDASQFLTKRALNSFLPFSRQMRAIRERGYSMAVDALLFFVIEELDLVNHFDAISKSKSEFEERRENVQELRQATKKYTSYGPAIKVPELRNPESDGFDNESALGNFLDDVALVSDITNDDSKSEDARLVINLMTIHASKGMEFDAVFVVGNEEGTLPSGMAMQEGEGSIALEEEKRLCYVAMTRAKTRLILTWRKEVTMFSSWSDDGPKTSQKDRSRFLDALVSKKSSGATSTKRGDSDEALRQRRQFSSSRQVPLRKPNVRDPRSRSTIDPPTRQQARPPSRNLSTGGVQSRSSSPTTRFQSKAPERRASPPITKRRQPTPTKKDSYNTSKSQTIGSRPSPNIRQRTSLDSPPLAPKPPAQQRSTARNVNSLASKTSQPQKSFDSTLFFPVGSSVVHENFGNGVVLQPPPSDNSKKLLVSVEFENGRTMEFPVEGRDLAPVF